ncbi:MAG: hypothetical protein RIR26_1609 [Pseudomonadota bacterium]|jgi:uncharacterized protein (TIGR01777 family)
MHRAPTWLEFIPSEMRHALEYKVSLPVKAESAYAWHEHHSAFNRLSPAWESQVMLSTDGITEGGRAVIAMAAPWGRMFWHAEHFDVRKGISFSDRQLKGPFQFWEHTHAFASVSAESSILMDRIQYELPFSPLSDLFAGGWIRRRLASMFAYRHRVLANDLAFWKQHPEKRMKRVLVTGSSGLIGREVAAFLAQGGYDVIGLSRSPSRQGNVVQWDLTTEDPKDARLLLDGRPLDAVIHLAGEGIAEKRWTRQQKDNLKRSRVEATHNLIQGLKRLGLEPRVLISASGVGFYGDRGDQELTENMPQGRGFLAELAEAWESAARVAATVFSARCVQLRMGAVLTARGGALQRMLLPFRAGLGGALGSGQQWMSWVALDDVLYAIAFALEKESLQGPVNLVSPQVVTNKEFTRTLAQVLSRPAVVPVPAFALRLALGEMADELLLNSQRARPAALLQAGFEFRYPELSAALSHTLGQG